MSRTSSITTHGWAPVSPVAAAASSSRRSCLRPSELRLGTRLLSLGPRLGPRDLLLRPRLCLGDSRLGPRLLLSKSRLSLSLLLGQSRLSLGLPLGDLGLGLSELSRCRCL